jgi:thiamine biosynthesis protein ThiS
MDANELQNISIVVNGAPEQVPSGLTVSALLIHLKVDPARVAVELNREIVRKTAWDRTLVEDGGRLEIVQFVGGGSVAATVQTPVG